MKLLPVLIPLSLVLSLSAPAGAAQKKSHPAEDATSAASEDRAASGDEGAGAKKPALDFDFFGGQPGDSAEPDGNVRSDASALDIKAQEWRRRWMLWTHQSLGIATWLSMVATVTIGQLNYNELYGGGGRQNTYQTPHRALVITTSALFAATATFSIFAPTPHKKPLQFDTGLVHRIAVIGATLGMLTEGVLGWVTTHQADAGNPHNLKTMAQVHQIVGYTTLGFLTVAGAVWLF